jgi:CHAD domain-containing protein
MAQAGRPAAAQEIERKYESVAAKQLPALDGLPGVSQVEGPDLLRLRATYFDTVDLRLAKRGITLRRRSGGDDAGWHLKLPVSADARVEMHEPLGQRATVVPTALLTFVLAYTRGAPLQPIARITTSRRQRRLVDADGVVLAHVAADGVTAHTLEALGEPAASQSWREVEVELSAADLKLLDDAEKVLTAAGFIRSNSSSKLANLLAERLPAGGHTDHQAPDAAAVDETMPAGDSEKQGKDELSAGSVLHEYLSKQVERLLSYDARVRGDEPDAVHQMRVASRRLRSALREFAELLDSAAIGNLGDELRWLAGVLGEVRDIEVLRERVLAELAALPADLVVGPVQSRVTGQLGGEYGAARERMLEAMVTARYFALLDRLDQLEAAPPLTELADGAAPDVLTGHVQRSWRRLAKRATRVLATEPEEEHATSVSAAAGGDRQVATAAEQIHDARKSAKRARYALEAVRPAMGRKARRLSKRLASVQEVLGTHQDTVVARAVIKRLCVKARQAGEETFTYGVLYQAEADHGQQAMSQFASAWQRASAKRRSKGYRRLTGDT